MVAKTRMIKVVKFTLGSGLNEVEETVNNEIEQLAKEGKKVVSITNYVCGNSPTRVVYNLIYESDVTV